MLTYRTADGRVLDLGELTAEQEAFLRRCHDAYGGGASWTELSRLVEGEENPLLRQTRGIITRTVWDHPMFQAVRDLEDRAGIRGGELDGDSDAVALEPLEDEWISVTAAAQAKGITIPGLHKAIQRGDVIAHARHPGGAWLLVSRNSLAGWQPNRVRQAARQRGSLSVQQERESR